jgi:hypothetical protein
VSKPPKSKIAIALVVISILFSVACAIAIYHFARLPGDTRLGTLAKINMLEVVRTTGFSALGTFVAAYVVQMISDIRWKLFESRTHGEMLEAAE